MPRCSVMGSAFLFALLGLGSPVTANTTEPSQDLIEDLVAANQILSAEGLLAGYGHVSARHDKNPEWFVISRSLPPELVTADDLLVLDLDGSVVDGRGNESPGLYSERFIHAEVYRNRTDVGAVLHHHSPISIIFSVSTTPLRAVSNQARFIGVDGVPKFDISEIEDTDRMTVRTPELGAALTVALGEEAAVLMSNHGAVVTGDSIPMVVGRAIFLDINAEMQLQAIALGGKVSYLHPRFATKIGNHARPWELWKRKHYPR